MDMRLSVGDEAFHKEIRQFLDENLDADYDAIAAANDSQTAPVTARYNPIGGWTGQEDAAQLVAAQALDRLHALAAISGRVFEQNRSQKTAACCGLYLYGAVGRGSPC